MKAGEFIITALKGFGMGAANVVPGVSGGTIALLTGIYGRIVDSLSSFTDKNTWKALFRGRFSEFWKLIGGNFLLALVIGVGASVFSLAKLMTVALEQHPVLTWAFFFGLILSSVAFMLRDIKGWKATDIIAIIAGIALGLAVCTLSPTETPSSGWFLFICGAIAICTMILPGISGSFILVILGKYDFIMQAVSELDYPVLAIFAAGCIVGILAFAKFLHWLLARWEKQTMLILTGFVIGSLVKVWPWNGSGSFIVPGEVPGALLWCAIGAALVIIIEISANKKSKQHASSSINTAQHQPVRRSETDRYR